MFLAEKEATLKRAAVLVSIPTLATFLAVEEHTIVDIATGVCLSSVALLHIFYEATLIGVSAISIRIFTLTMKFVVLKVSLIYWPV